MQVALQQAKASTASGRLTHIENALETRKAEVRTGATQILQAVTGTALHSYAGFAAVSQHHIKDLESQAVAARKALSVELNLLKEADRKAQLLENLKESRKNSWQKEFDREIGAFADESFLSRLGQSRYNRGNGRARSSGG